MLQRLCGATPRSLVCVLRGSGCRRRWASTVQKTTGKGGEERTAVTSDRSILEQVLIKEPVKPQTTAGKVREKATNTFFYVFLASSVAALAGLCYLMFDQFFSADSPQTVFSQALALVRGDARCADLFGEPIAGFGEETSRGRRRHVWNLKYEKGGIRRVRVMFHLKGSRKQGIGQAEKHYVDGTWQWRYVLVETLDFPRRSHVIIDNRTGND